MMGFSSLMFIFAILSFFPFLVTSAIVDIIRPSDLMRENTTLVSRDGSFELGFFTPGNSKNRYLGVWYKNIPVRTVVWVANRCKPINDSSGLLTINETGDLVLFGQNKSVVWSTSSLKPAQQPLVQLLDSGNLVLRDEKDENTGDYLWESFDYPTDTNMPGMKIGWDLRRNLTRRLSAWKSFDDPCNGDFTYGIELDQRRHTYPEPMIRKGSAKFYRTGPWNGVSFTGTPDLRPNPLFDYGFVYNDDEVYYIYNLKNKSVISRIVMNQTTSVRQRMVWIEAEKIWKPYNSAPRDQCDNYGICGANSECVITNNPVCQCLKGFKPKIEENWKAMYWSEGCVRSSPLNCRDKEKDGFLTFSGLKVPDTQFTWVNKSVNIRECRAKCLSDCSCTAYTNSDIGEGSGCVLWFGDLFDIRQFSSGGQDLFIRVSASEIEKARAGRKVKKAVLVVAIVVALASGLILVGYYIRRRRHSFFEETNVIINRDENQEDDLELPLFSLHTISTATNNFSQNSKLGEGGFGPVYRGMLEGGQEFAVKRLSMWSGQGDNEFKNEVKLIAKLQHRNLVKILGCCIQGEEKLLMYEYMPNKSLDYFIFDERQGRLLDWPKRFQIICGIAKGLLYLHHDSRLRIIHRDLKASNVLLDEEMNPKISDFGLARTFGGDQLEGNTSKVVGTYGYMAPEYAFDGLFSIKSDVFSFGILMLEIICGKRSRGYYYENNGLTLIGYAWTLLKEGKAFKLIDKCLRESDENIEEALRCIHVSLLCVQQSPIDRPNMLSVVLMLSSESTLPQPKPPGYFTETDMWGGDQSASRKFLSSSSKCDMTISVVEPR
ncbi:G-type lectin S-receptor-like serine/threonine-protein kinase At4g27290 isoform X2 [Humulus lupulus]|uniref:G-type lectin S-receptor-like serine/threonine-protein kinase At4g27290 isoform X2 n=1 Tax=Humulus lupulus TaxID=3486 RepID=UPI002B409AD8|nr:G-type lectin S-receptor-like serine/threonine-protein kinase At4g27290 isoform X2 [Humulus lupulus]